MRGVYPVRENSINCFAEAIYFERSLEIELVSYCENKEADLACWITERKSYSPLKFDFNNRRFKQTTSFVMRVSRYNGANCHYYDATYFINRSPHYRYLSPHLRISPSSKYLLLTLMQENRTEYSRYHVRRYRRFTCLGFYNVSL